MPNFFSENQDLLFHFSQIDLSEIISLMDSGDGKPRQQVDTSRYLEVTDTYRASLELLGNICAREIAPRSSAIDVSGTCLVDGKVKYSTDTELVRGILAEAGFMGVMLPTKYGGAGFPATIYMMMIEMVSRADASLMTLFGYQDVGELIARFGSEQQCRTYLPGLAAGESIGAIVLSEPGAGSDLQAVRLSAIQADDETWRLRGTKHFISNGGGDVLLVLARSEPANSKMFGLSLFVCPRSDRVKVSRIEEKMGLHGSPTCELHFDDAPAELIGRRKVGLTKYVLESLNQARFSVAAQALGIAEGAYQQAVEYAGQRRQFGRKIAEFPAVQRMLDNMALAIHSNRSLLYYAVQWLDLKVQLAESIAHGRLVTADLAAVKTRMRVASQCVSLLSPLVKYVVTESANRVCYDAQQVFGGLGYMRETGIERRVRDVRITTIYEGTSQIQAGASLKQILSDVLGDQFDVLARTDYPPELRDAARQVADSRAGFGRLLDILRQYNCSELNEAMASDLADIYSQILGSYLFLRDATVTPAKSTMAAAYCAELGVRVLATSEALRNGRYRRWQRN